MIDITKFQEGSTNKKMALLDEPEVSARTESPSSNAVAAQSALLSDSEDVMSAYQSAKEDSQVVSEIVEGINNIENQNAVDTTAQMLVNGEIDQETAALALNTIPKENRNSLDLVVEKMAVKPSGEETPTEESFRIEEGSIASIINQRRRRKQQVRNNIEIFGGKQGRGEAAIDLAERMLPYAEQAFTVTLSNYIEGEDTPNLLKQIFLNGHAKVDFRKMYEDMDYSQRDAFILSLAKVINNSKSLLFLNDNDLAHKDFFDTITVEGHYTEFDKWMDTVSSVLDAVGMGFLSRSVARSLRMPELDHLDIRVDGDGWDSEVMRANRGGATPSSTLSSVADANPEEARNLQAIIEEDVTGEAASALAGTSREEAILDTGLPQMNTPDGVIESKPFALDSKVAEVLEESGNIYRTPTEIARAQDRVIGRIGAVNGLVIHDTKSVVVGRKENGNVQYAATYGPGGGRGWDNPQDALDSTVFRFRDYKLDESNVTILRKTADGYVPTTVKEVMAKEALRQEYVKKKKKLPEELKRHNLRNEYLAKVDFEYELNPLDIVEREALDVKRNYFDSVPILNKLKLNRNINQIANMLHPTIVGGADVAVDTANRLSKVLTMHGKKFLEPFKKLDNAKQDTILQLFEEQNIAGKRFSKDTLLGKGLTEEEIKLFDYWKELNDQLWHLENADMISHLNNTGHKLFIDRVTESQWVVKEIGKEQAAGKKVYDPNQQKIVSITAQELEELYENGGTISALKKAEDTDVGLIEYVKVYNSEKSSYTRSIRSSDHILNYRQGQYTVRYKDPHFIIKEHPDGRTEAILTSPDIKSAEMAVRHLQREDSASNVKYYYRANRDLNRTESLDLTYDMMVNAGRTAQKYRGKTLKQFNNTSTENQVANIQSPIESLKHSINSISQRTAMRDYMDDFAQRIIYQYEKLLPTKNGQPYIPRNIDEIVQKGKGTDKERRDLLTNVEYYNYLRDGYTNTVDEVWKGMFNALGNMTGKWSTGLEKMFRTVLEEVPSPVGWLRGRAFDMYIATAMPTTQWLVQGHAAIATAALWPKYAAKGGMARDITRLMSSYIIDKTPMAKKLYTEAEFKAIQQVRKEWDETGFGAGIDRHNMVEGAIDTLIETQRLARTKKVYRAVVETGRRAGFDPGEFMNLASYWLGNRNAAIQEGKKMSNPRVRDEVMAKTRAMTMHMNKAGDMPFQKNSASLLMQFMQAPMKALTLMFDRGLTPKEKATLTTWNLMMVPLPTAVGYHIVNSLNIEDETLKDVAYNGIMGMTFNTIARTAYGDNTSVSFQKMTLSDPYVPIDFIHGLVTEGLGSAFANSATLSPYLSEHNPIVVNFLKETGKYLGSLVTEAGEDDAQGVLAFESFLNLTGAGRNFSREFRQRILQKRNDRYSALNTKTKENVTSTEEFMKKYFGTETTFEAVAREISGIDYRESTSRKEDIREYVNGLNKLMEVSGFDVDNPERLEYYYTRVVPEVLGEFNDNDLKYFGSLVEKAAKKNGNIPIYENIYRKAVGGDIDKAREMANALPFAAQELVQYLDSVEAVKDVLGEEDVDR